MSATAGGGGKGGTLVVNVVNMIDILIILLVFLLTNFATSTFEDAASLPARMPVFGDGDHDPDRRGITMLEVRMELAQAFKILVQVGGQETGVIDVAPRRGGGFDYEKLSDELLKIKQAYDSRKDLLLEANKQLAFDDVVKAMDACREKVVRGDGQLMRLSLFPAVALTDLP